ncbi:MAG TPA: hypothetical protein VF887_03740, partial [Gemmatimonadaceae bacterium]
MIGHFLKASSRTVTRSGVLATTVGAVIILAAIGATRADAQVPTADTARAPRTDTTNNLVMTSDTTQEVKH